VATFLLVRHAENDFGGSGRIAGRVPGVHLNAKGREQAERLAERLAGAGIGAIFSSPLERALETAAPLAARLGLQIEVAEAFTEVDFGEWTGKHFDDLRRNPRWRAFNTFRSGTRIPGGELSVEVQSRMVTEMENLRGRNPERVIAVFSHGDPIKSALAHYAGVPIDLYKRFEISTASVTTIDLNEWGPRILGVNAGC
jgi:probable phosphoglycerate mutase